MGDARLVLPEAERRALENWAKRRKTAQGLALRDALTGIDDRNLQALVTAVLRASGQRQFP